MLDPALKVLESVVIDVLAEKGYEESTLDSDHRFNVLLESNYVKDYLHSLLTSLNWDEVNKEVLRKINKKESPKVMEYFTKGSFWLSEGALIQIVRVYYDESAWINIGTIVFKEEKINSGNWVPCSDPPNIIELKFKNFANMLDKLKPVKVKRYHRIVTEV